jgi:hypothetical protein
MNSDQNSAPFFLKHTTNAVDIFFFNNEDQYYLMGQDSNFTLDINNGEIRGDGKIISMTDPYITGYKIYGCDEAQITKINVSSIENDDSLVINALNFAIESGTLGTLMDYQSGIQFVLFSPDAKTRINLVNHVDPISNNTISGFDKIIAGDTVNKLITGYKIDATSLTINGSALEGYNIYQSRFFA